MTRAVAGYDAAATALVPAYEAIDPERLYAPVVDLFPPAPATVLDVGAGTGRDAAWLAGRGHRVTAVEPSAALHDAGARLHAHRAIRWVADALPALVRVDGLDGGCDLVLLSGVWHHLSPDEREVAMPRLAALLRAGGTLVMSLRHGPSPADRPGFAAPPGDTVAGAVAAGLRPVRERAAPSIGAANRAAGVHWTWLAFVRDA